METRIGFPDLDRVDYAKGGGLVPAIVQHAGAGTVLMVGYMNREALEATLTRGRVVFFSRSKNRLWEKGETSGNFIEVAEIYVDCDGDALIVHAWPQGETCHLGRQSCFEGQNPGSRLSFLAKLEHVIAERTVDRPQGSYTAKLAASGVRRVAQKVCEEALEAALAASAGDETEVVSETADLLYHVLVLLNVRGVRLDRVVAELQTRHQPDRKQASRRII
jgi:phosphoribosyl-AMP cyclohydrolase / phosphoribosyl-ATP pyrophosphohydrolase